MRDASPGRGTENPLKWTPPWVERKALGGSNAKAILGEEERAEKRARMSGKQICI